jgi:threonine/homoserine/homoserine lactone efflux protein
MNLTYDLLIALVTFCFATSITPGPNNMMLLASGANFGFARSAPHMLGISIGFVVMVALVGIGLGRLFDLLPWLERVLTWASLAYLLWLALKIARSGEPQSRNVARPMTFLGAAAFQWVNPKAWGMALSATSVYAPDHSLVAALTVALLFGAVNLPSIALWCLLGVKLRAFLSSASRLRAFNWTMAALLIVSALPVLWH